MERKKKICKKCMTPQFIWAYGNCKDCDGKLRSEKEKSTRPDQSIARKQIVAVRGDNKVGQGRSVYSIAGTGKMIKTIAKQSDKQKKITQAYNVLRKQFLKDKPYCGIEFQNCTHIATDIHHKGIGSNKRKYYNDTTTWVQCCRHCHDTTHDLSSVEQYALGLRIKT